MENNRSKQPKIIQSVDKALNILEIFSAETFELGVTEIASRLNMNKSTAFGLISTLENRGFLIQNPENGRYRLGFSLLAAAGAIKELNNVALVAKPVLRKLVDKIKETVHLAVYNSGEIVYIDKVESNQTLQIASYIGKKNPAYCTGVGKCLLAFEPEAEIDRVLSEPMEKLTPKTVTDKDILKNELARIRNSSISFDNEEFTLGLQCIAVPVRNASGNVCAALSVSYPTIRATKDMSAELRSEITAAAKEISSLLGFSS